MEIQLRKLIEIESSLDKFNGDYGDEKGYCVFCKSTSYNGEVGIEHNKNCAIIQLRTKIKEYL